MNIKEPTYTQVPNVLLDNMHLLTDAELRVTLAIVRKTIGYHKSGPEPISYTQIEKLTGLSRQGAINGVKAAIDRGTVKLNGKGKRGVHLYAMNMKESTPLTSGDDQESADWSTELTSTSQPSRPVLVNGVDTQKKILKETFKDKNLDDAPNGGHHAQVGEDSTAPDLTTGPVKEPARDLHFEVIVERGFGVPLDDAAAVAAVRGKANWIASWCKGNAVKMSSRDKDKSLPGCAPPLTVEGLNKFLDYMAESHPGIEFTTPQVWAKYVGRARRELSGSNGHAKTHAVPDPDCDRCGGAGFVKRDNWDPVTNPGTVVCSCVQRKAVAHE